MSDAPPVFVRVPLFYICHVEPFCFPVQRQKRLTPQFTMLCVALLLPIISRHPGLLLDCSKIVPGLVLKNHKPFDAVQLASLMRKVLGRGRGYLVVPVALLAGGHVSIARYQVSV